MINDIYQLIDVITGYQPAAVVTAACRVGVFDVLSPTESRTPAEVAVKLDLSADVTGRLLAALEAIGLVARAGDGYIASELAAQELRSGQDMVLVVEKEAFFARQWLDLDDTLRTGAPRLRPWEERVDTDPAQARAFLEALDVLARRTGPPLAGMGELAPGRRVVDVGGGLGSYARMLADAGSSVTLVDLPPVIEWARQRQAGVEGITYVAADVLAHPSAGVEPSSHDAALVSHMVHDLPREPAVALLEAAAHAVRRGGAVVVNDFAGDSGPGAFGPLFDVMMAVETGGTSHRLAELRAMLEEVGLIEVEVKDLPPPLTVVVGRVP